MWDLLCLCSKVRVSLEPTLVLWSIRRESRSCTHFAVNVLAEDKIQLSQRFAGLARSMRSWWPA